MEDFGHSAVEGVRRAGGFSVIALLLSVPLRAGEIPVTTFPPPVDPSGWTSLLQKYVDPNGQVDYARWKADSVDRRKLGSYLAKIAAPGGALSGDQEIATLLNAYNAYMVETILDHYKVDSVRSIPEGFTGQTHAVGGKRYSLDEIEHTAIRLVGYRAHSAMVCASRSCPPLDRRAYEAGEVSGRLDERMRAWMMREDLYQFDPARNLVRLPKYFDWYRADFEKAGIAKVLSMYAPARFREWLARGMFKIEYLEYDWRLNDRDHPD